MATTGSRMISHIKCPICREPLPDRLPGDHIFPLKLLFCCNYFMYYAVSFSERYMRIFLQRWVLGT